MNCREQNLGRARFIILDDQRHLASVMYKMKGKTPEGAPRLFDLIKTQKEAYLPAFYFALRDTLVASDLQQAKRWAYGKTRFRVVTLAGNIIDKAGTVTGGGNAISKGGGMRSTLAEAGLSKQEMNKLQNDIEALRSKLSALRKQIYALKDEEEKLSAIVEGATLQLTKLQMDAEANKKHEKELRKRIPELKKNSSNTSNAEDLERISSLHKEIETLQTPLNNALKAAAKYEVSDHKSY